MRTLSKYIAALFACVMVLSACQAPGDTQGTSAPSGNGQPSSGSTQPSATQSTAEPTKPTDPAKLAEFNALFGDLDGWYNRFLTCQYDSAANISLKQIFYIGFTDESRTPTDAEWAELGELDGFQAEYDLIRLPREKMHEVLITYFGIPLDALPAQAFDGLVYLESTDCYYFMTTDAFAAMGFQASAVEPQENGTIRVEYTLDGTSQLYAVTVWADEDEYILLSNVAVVD